MTLDPIIWQWFTEDPNIQILNPLLDMAGWYHHGDGELDADGSEWWDGPDHCVSRGDWRVRENLGYTCVMRYWPSPRKRFGDGIINDV